jgi:hypothetical protein
MHGQISKYKCDFLPRFTITTTTHMMEIHMGFLCCRLWLTIFSHQMQEFNKNNA